MVFTEGLRAPAIGPALGRSVAPAVQSNIGRAAATGLLTGLTAIGAAGTALDAAQAVAPYAKSVGQIARMEAAAAQASVNPLLQGLQAQAAPALGGKAVQGTGSALSSAAARAIPPTLGSSVGGASAVAAGSLPQVGATAAGLLPQALSAAGRFSPLFYLPLLAEFARGDDVADEAGALAKAESAALSQKKIERNRAQRKGDTSAPKTKKPPKIEQYGDAGHLYIVKASGQFKNQDVSHFENVVRGPVSLRHTSKDGIDVYSLIYGGGIEAGYMSGASTAFAQPTKIDSVSRADGGYVPQQTEAPQNFQPDGSPLVVDTTPAPTNSSTPQLPGTAARSPSPVQGSLPAANAPTTPREGFKAPSAAPTPSTPTANSPSAPSLPSVASPLSAPSPSLPSIPAAPTTGSASSTMASAFPSNFTQFPGERNENALKPTEPEKQEQPKKKPKCEDPCTADLQNEAEKNKPVEIVVKVFKSCKISGGTTSAPSTPTTPTTPASGTTTPASGTTTTTTGSGGGVTSTVSTGTISNPTISDGVNKPTKSDGTPPFESQTVQEGNALFETRSIKVPGQEAANYKLLYERIAKLEAQHCDGLADGAGQAIASVPEWWQLRAEAQRPQLVIIFSEVFATGKLGKSRWSLTIPHYNKPKGFKPKIPAYEKGNFQGVLTLTDNSKLIVNAKSMTECKRVLNSLKLFVPASYRTRNGKGIKPKVGELPDAGFKVCRVTPSRADFYKTGARNLTPDWSIDFKAKA